MKESNLQKKLVRMQLFIILPALILLICLSSFFYFHKYNSQSVETILKRLEYTSESINDIYKQTSKFLEKPYSNPELYKIITKTPEEYEENLLQKSRDIDIAQNILFRDFIYYNPYISSVVLVPANRDESYLKYSEYQNILNYNLDFMKLKETQWYLDASKSNVYQISEAYLDPMFVGNVPAISFTQRIRNPFSDNILGVIKLNLNIVKFHDIFTQAIEFPNDELIVLDKNHQVLFSTNEDYPLLYQMDKNFSSFQYEKIQYVAKNSTEMTFLYYINRTNILHAMMIPISLILSFSVLMILVLVYLINKSSKSFNEPIIKLKNVMKIAETGDLNVRSETFEGEMKELGTAFNSLMDEMQKLIYDIQKAEFDKSNLQYEITLSKVNPHFLYNTLNAIKWKAELLGVNSIANTLDSLVEFLKATIKDTNIIITLEEELALLDHYMQIMRLRYEDDIEINFDIDDTCMNIQVAKLCIQPILENCYIHAFQNHQERKEINVTITKDATFLYIEVKDNGDGMDLASIAKFENGEIKRKNNSIGINNVIQRIQRLFGTSASVDIQSELSLYTCVTIKIPYGGELA